MKRKILQPARPVRRAFPLDADFASLCPARRLTAGLFLRCPLKRASRQRRLNNETGDEPVSVLFCEESMDNTNC